MMKPWRLQELTLHETRSSDFRVAILPVGSTEAHGPHVPYGSDVFHATAIADLVAEKSSAAGARVVTLPCLPFGVQGNTMGFPYTINASQSTLDTMVTDIIRSLEFHKVHSLVIVNGHGGNDFKPLLRGMYGRTPVFLALVDWWKVGSDKARELFEHPGEHADEMEASVGLALFPELVHIERAGDGGTHASRFEAIQKGWVSVARPWHLVTKDSTFGDPRKATREKGEAYVSLVVERLSEFIVDLSGAERDERFPY